jgi:hypothetical protein
MRVLTTEVDDISKLQEEMRVRKPLPIGRSQFIEWSDRIIQGAQVEGKKESLRFALAAMIMHLGPTEAFKEDGYFILALRKSASNQTAHHLMSEIKELQEHRSAEATALKEATPHLGIVEDVLENPELPPAS